MVTVITKTIGPTGRDYSTFTLAEADVTNIGTSADLVANDEAIVFEADAGDYTGNFTFYTAGGLTCDATRNVTWTHATGAGHGGVFEAGVNIVGYCQMREDFAVVDGLSVSPPSTSATYISDGAVGVTVRNVMSYSATASAFRLEKGGTAAAPCVVENCVAKSDASRTLDIRSETSGVDSHWRLVNCTAFVPSGYYAFNLGLSSSDNLYVQLTNNLVIGDREYIVFSGPTVTLTGSDNFGKGTNAFPAAVQGSPYPITATTSFSTPLGSGDYAVYMGATGALADVTGNDVWQQGVGPGSNSDVPTTDINGVARSGASCNPGAFEADGFVSPTVITKTIGPSGRDYATFTLAEAAVTSIGSGTDLTFYNEAIVFEADAGTYSESVTFFSSLTTDATRQVTYKPAAGSEHGGVFGAGPHIASTGTAALVYDNYTAFVGLSMVGTSVTWSSQGAAGYLVDGCLIRSTTSQFAFFATGAPDSAPGVLRNSVLKQDTNFKALRYLIGSSGSETYRTINCTVLTSSRMQMESRGGTLNVDFVNCISFGPGYEETISGGGTVVSTGSNNFSSSSFQFPAALQGSPYPITAVTDPEQPAAGDYAIHDAQGRLYDTSRNDVLQTGVGPSANSDVPTTDITGEARSGATCNPGAFEATVVLSISTPAAGALNNSPDFRVHLDRRVTDASFGVSAVYDSASDSTTFTLPYRLNAYARMQVVTRKTSGANAGELLSVTATDANAGTVTVAGNHTSTAVFIGETYIMKYEFSTPHLQAQQRMSPTKGASHRIRYGTVTFADTSFFEVKVKPKGGDAYTYTFNGNLLNEPETLLGQVAVYDGDFKFPVMADHDRATVTLENDSPLPSRFLGCEWEAFYHSRIGQRSRF